MTGEKSTDETTNMKGNSIGLEAFIEPLEVLGKQVPMRVECPEDPTEASDYGWYTAAQPHQQRGSSGHQQKEKSLEDSTFTTTFSII